jgi:hypothetical protein
LVGSNLVAVVAHADMPNQPQPGSLLRTVCKSPPHAALVVFLVSDGDGDNGRSRNGRDRTRYPVPT